MAANPRHVHADNGTTKAVTWGRPPFPAWTGRIPHAEVT
jgi:hypothetical protein